MLLANDWYGERAGLGEASQEYAVEEEVSLEGCTLRAFVKMTWKHRALLRLSVGLEL